MTVVLPGTFVQVPATASSSENAEGSSSSSSSIRLGPGLLYPTPHSKESPSPYLLSTLAGHVGHLASSSPSSKGKAKSRSSGWWIESHSKRYVPCPSDPIIGQVTARNADFYTLSLHSAHSATLPVLAFEGATKRHRPNIKIGALVYGLVVGASSGASNVPGLEVEVTCVDPTTGKGNGMGELDISKGSSFLLDDHDAEDSGTAAAAAAAADNAGFTGTVEISLNLARSLLRPTHPLLPLLASHFPFESAIGANGLLWFKVREPSHFIAIKTLLEQVDDPSVSPHTHTQRLVEEEREQQVFGEEQEEETEQGQEQEQEESLGQTGRRLASTWGTRLPWSPSSATTSSKTKSKFSKVPGGVSGGGATGPATAMTRGRRTTMTEEVNEKNVARVVNSVLMAA